MSRAGRLKRLGNLERSRLSTQYSVTRALVRQDERGQLETYLELRYTLENGVRTVIELPDNGRAVS